MKTKSTLRSFLALVGSSLLAISYTHAQTTYYWDSNDTAAGFGNTTGIWGTSTFWSTDPAGTAAAANPATTSADTVNFGTATLNYANGAVGVAAGGVSVGSIVFGAGQTTGITLGTAGNAITITNGITKNIGSAAMTISSPLILGGAQSWLNNSTGLLTVGTGAVDNGGFLLTIGGSGNATVSSVISNTGALTKTGAGQLTLSGTNSFGGQLSIERGTVYTTTAINNKSVNGVLGAGTTVVLGASGQTGRLAIQVDGSTSSTKDFTLTTGGTGEIQFGNLGSFQNTNADRSLTLSGSISGSGNFTKLGGAAVVLSGNNTYSGTTTINEGALRLSSATALPGGVGATGGTSALIINGNGAINVGATIQLTAASGDFLRGLGTGVDQFQITGGVSGFDANGSTRQVIVGNNAATELQWGSTSFNPSALLLGFHQYSATGAITLQNKIDLNGATRTILVNTGAAVATLSGDIRTASGTAGLTKTGGGTLVLSGANTYDGATTISAGTLTLGSAGALGGTSQIVLGGTSTLHVNFANLSLAKLATGGAVPLGTFLRYSQAQTTAGASNGPGTILGTVELNVTNVNPDYTLDFGGSLSTLKNLVTATYNSPITLSGSITSIDSSTAVFTGGTGMTIGASTAGAKTLLLTGSNTGANTLGGVIGNGSGTVAVTKTNSGSWALTGTNTYSGATTVSAGTLTLSGANGSIGNSAVTIAGGTLTISNANAANNGDRLSGSSAFTMNGGTFNFNNDATVNNFSESAGTLSLVGGANTVAIQQAAVAQTSTLTFAGLSRTAGAVNFSGAGLGVAVNPRSKITFTSAPTLTDGIIGTWATVNGTDYATLIGNDVVAYGGAMTDLTRQNSGTKAIPDSATADVRIIEGTGGSPANLTLAATTTTIDTLLNSVSGGTAATTIDIASGQTLRVNSINSVATAGTLTLGTAANTGTLAPATAGGDLLLINSSANITTVNSVIANNTSASSITKDGSGVVRLNGTNTYSGGTVLNAGTVWVTTNTNLGDTATAAGITFNGPAALSYGLNTASGVSATLDLGLRPITLNNGAVVGLYYNEANKTITASGAITGDGGIVYGRDPVLAFGGGSGFENLNLLSNSNSFTGPITLGVNASENVGVASTITVNSLANSTSPITFNLGGGWSFDLGSGATQNMSLPSRPINLRNSNTTIRNQNATKTMTLGAVSTSTAGAKTLNLGNGGFGSTVAGAITNGNGTLAVTKSGTGTWSLSGANTYSGVTNLSTDGGQLTILGKPALSGNTPQVVMARNTTLSLRMDDAGTVNLGNEIELSASDTSSNLTSSYTVEVRNNGGATTGSTLVLGKLDFAGNSGNNASGRRILSTGANGYRLQFGDVDLSYAVLGTATGGPQRFEPQTAPITITGTIRQISGNTGASTTDNNLYLGGIASGNLVSGTIADAADYPSNANATPLNITKGETSDWTLSGANTYTGATTLTAGTLSVGASNNLGAAASNLVFNGGTLQITGTALTNFSGIGHTVSFTAAKAVGLDIQNAAHTFTVDQVLNQTTGGFTKSGLGKVVLNQANTYTGATTVSTGTLELGVDDCLANTSNVAIAAGTLKAAANVNDTVGTLDPTAAATIDLGSGATLAFAASNGVSWTGGTLNLTGSLDFSGTATSSLRFGTTSSGLTAGQLTQISAIGWTSFSLNASGYLTATSTGGGSAYDTWAGGPGLPFDADANGDGVKNGLAFLLGAANPSENAIGRLPTVTQSGGNLILNFNCLPIAARGTATLKVAHSTNLGSWTTTTDVVPDANDPTPDNHVTFVVGAGPAGPPELNSVTATIGSAAATGTGKLFDRLEATQP